MPVLMPGSLILTVADAVAASGNDSTSPAVAWAAVACCRHKNC